MIGSAVTEIAIPTSTFYSLDKLVKAVVDRKPDNSRCTTTQQGLITCMRSVNDQCVRQLGAGIDESEIQHIMRNGTSDIDEEYLNIIKKEITDW
jgi:plasmid segregation protein ParM